MIAFRMPQPSILESVRTEETLNRYETLATGNGDKELLKTSTYRGV